MTNHKNTVIDFLKMLKSRKSSDELKEASEKGRQILLKEEYEIMIVLSLLPERS